jgi:hypothetical protein
VRAWGAVEEAPLASIPLARPVERLDGSAPVAICMTAGDPPMALFRRQIVSIREQTHEDWPRVISDDCSAPDRYAAIQECWATTRASGSRGRRAASASTATSSAR